ncbi:MAG: hypothetical protein ACI9JN_002158 [Bacteroidia bacterium]|jgi:hypothetical protein
MRTLIFAFLLLSSTIVLGQQHDDYELDTFGNPCWTYFHLSNPLKIDLPFTDRATLKYVRSEKIRELQKSWLVGDERFLETVYFDTLSRIDSVVTNNGSYSTTTIRCKYDGSGRLYFKEDLNRSASATIGFKEIIIYSPDGEIQKSHFWLVNKSDFEDVEDIIDTVTTVCYDTTIGDLRRYIEVDTIHWRYYYWLQNGKLILAGTEDSYDQADYEENELGYSIRYHRTEFDTISFLAFEEYDDFNQLKSRKVVSEINDQVVLVEENRYNRFQQLITSAIFCDNEQVRTYIRDVHSGVILKEIVKSNNAPTYEVKYTYH